MTARRFIAAAITLGSVTAGALAGCAAAGPTPFTERIVGSWDCRPDAADGLDATGNPRTWHATIDADTIELEEHLNGSVWVFFYGYAPTQAGMQLSQQGFAERLPEGLSPLVEQDPELTFQLTAPEDVSDGKGLFVRGTSTTGAEQVGFELQPSGKGYRIAEEHGSDSWICEPA